LHFFDRYSATYGSLGAVIILLLWYYWSGAAVLMGAEINSVLENAAAEGGEPDAKLKPMQLDSVPAVLPTSGLPNSSERATPKSSKSILK